MNIAKIKQELSTPTARLTVTYLLIIMIMSIGFSIVFFNASSQQLHRQVPSDAWFARREIDPAGDRPEIRDFLENRAEEGRHILLNRLIALNIAALVAGGVVSYWLARRNLEPIEAAMEAQSRFVSDASHELRTPLTAIQAGNEVALRKPNLTLAAAKQVIAHNTEDALRLKSLSDGLLDLARQEKSQKKLYAVALQDAVTDAINKVVPMALHKHISVEDRVPAVTVLADHELLVQVLVILLDNAVKYSQPDKQVEVTAKTIGRHVHIRIIDQGIGIDESDLPHIFDRFYRSDLSRTDSKREGYGLGLAIAKNITRQLDGDLKVTSELGRGSIFTLMLALAK